MTFPKTGGRPEPEPTPSQIARRNFSGPAFLSGGFRPFFFAAGVWGAFALGLWLLILNGRVDAPEALGASAWHAHEMLFGFAAAAIAGFLLTAIPNWTGRLPVRGWPLAGLASLWLTGRLALLFAGAGNWQYAAAVIDLAFPVTLLGLVLREIILGGNWRNLPIAGIIGLLIVGNVLMHLEALGMKVLSGSGWRLGIGAVLLLISLVGGRITPSFTRNWLAKRGDTKLPAPFGVIDKAALGLTGLAMLVWIILPEATASGWLVLAAGVVQAARLSRWRGLAAVSDPLVLVLHVGYGWISIGFVLLGLSVLTDGFTQTDAIHGMTIGAIGTMILAVMTRASLGHSGRVLKAGAGTLIIYLLVTCAVAARLLAAWGTDAYLLHVYVSGLAWIAAFALFAVLYAPLHFRKRRGS